MSINIAFERKKFLEQYDFDVEKYTSDEIVDELETNLVGVLEFGMTAFLPIILTGLASIILSILCGYFYNSLIFGIGFFVCCIPIFLFGAGALGISQAIINLVTGISYILGYTINVTRDMNRSINKKSKTKIKTWEITKFVLYAIVFPVVKKMMRNRFLGSIIYFIIKKVTTKGAKFLSNAEDSKQDKSHIELSDKAECINIDSNSNNKSFSDIARVAMKGTVIFLRIAGIFSMIVGVILLIILFCVQLLLK